MEIKPGMEARWAEMQAQAIKVRRPRRQGKRAAWRAVQESLADPSPSQIWSGVNTAELFAGVAEFLFEKGRFSVDDPDPAFDHTAKRVDTLMQPSCLPAHRAMDEILGELWVHGDAYKLWATKAGRLAA